MILPANQRLAALPAWSVADVRELLQAMMPRQTQSESIIIDRLADNTERETRLELATACLEGKWPKEWDEGGNVAVCKCAG